MYLKEITAINRFTAVMLEFRYVALFVQRPFYKVTKTESELG